MIASRLFGGKVVGSNPATPTRGRFNRIGPFFYFEPMHFVYILRSEVSGKYYCGESADVEDRLRRHNGGYSKSTKSGRPWISAKSIICADRSSARSLESTIKKRGIQRWLDSNG